MTFWLKFIYVIYKLLKMTFKKNLFLFIDPGVQTFELFAKNPHLEGIIIDLLYNHIRYYISIGY